MSRNIFLHELRIRRKSVLVWSLATAALIGFFFSIFPSFAEQAELTQELLKKFPPELLAAFGMNQLDMAAITGFFAFLFIFVQLCLAIQAGNYGFGLISIEENERTADFLLTRPVSRAQVLTSKLLAAFASLTITNLVIWAVSFAAIEAFRGERSYDTGVILLLLASIAIFQLLFLAIGVLVSVLVKRIRSVTPYSLGLGFGMYTLSAFSGVFGDIKLEYITPFKHFDTAYIIQNRAFNTPFLLADVAIIGMCIALTYVLYIRRDIHAVS